MARKFTKAQKKLWLTVALYVAVTFVFVLSLTVILVLANGYKPSFRNGHLQLEKTGMLLVATRPSDASMSLNGKYYLNTGLYFFPSRVSGLLPGWYNTVLKKTGFRTWTKNLQIEPGMVTWANYALLFPDKLDISKVSQLGSGYLGQSKNGHNLLFAGKKGTQNTLISYDTANLSEKNFWPASSLLESQPEWLKNPNFISGSLDDQNQRALLLLTNGPITEYVLFDFSGSDPKITILNDQLKNTPSDLTFNPANGSELFLTLSGSLYRYQVSTKSAGSALAENVVSYYLAPNQQIFYANRVNGTTNRISKMNLDGGSKSVVVEASISEKGYRFAYNGTSDTLAIVNKDNGELSLVSPTAADNSTTTKLAKNIIDMRWQKAGHKLVYYSENRIYTLDTERQKTVSFEVSGGIKDVEWYVDDAHFTIFAGNRSFLADFDGNNTVDLQSSGTTKVISDDRDNNLILATGTETAGLENYFRFVSPY